MGKTNIFPSTLPFSPWAVSATWLHVGALQKIQELDLDVLGVHGKLLKYVVHSSKRKN
jgi:hypothetical protein